MSTVYLVLVATERDGWLIERARDVLARCDVVYADARVPQEWLGNLMHATARRVEVGGTEEEWRRAWAEMISSARAGRSIARVHWQAGCHDEAVLRDARSLREASVPFEVVPGTDPLAKDWESWVAARPLCGRRVAVLRMRGQASETAEQLRMRGAIPWVVPTIELHPPPDPAPMIDALRSLGSYDVAAFTSANGVERTFEVLGELGLDARAFASCRVAAVGAITAKRLADHGIVADTVAKEFRGESLAESIVDVLKEKHAARVLVLRALEAREVLPDLLRNAGATVDVVAAYQTLPPPASEVEPLRRALQLGHLDAVLLTASSTVTNLCEALGEGYAELLSGVCLASIGPITSDRARALGLSVTVEAEQFTIAGVIEALERYFG